MKFHLQLFSPGQQSSSGAGGSRSGFFGSGSAKSAPSKGGLIGRSGRRLSSLQVRVETGKLERLPEYFRDTMDWLIGRSRRKADGKENGGPHPESARGRSWDGRSRVGPSASAEFSVCEYIHEDEFRRLVVRPAGMEHNEWLATHALSFFHHINALYGAVAEYCTAESCPVMCGTGQVQYPWVDDRGKKCKYSAAQYIDCVMSFTEKTVSCEQAFPTKYGNSFPPSFDSVIRRLCRLLWHVLSHLHCNHWEHLILTNLTSQAAAVTAHLHAFCKEFSLLDGKEESLLMECVRSVRPPLLNPAVENNPIPPPDLRSAAEVKSATDGVINQTDNNACDLADTQRLIDDFRGDSMPPAGGPPANPSGGSWGSGSGSLPNNYGMACAQTC